MGSDAHRIPIFISTIDQIFIGIISKNGSFETVYLCRNVRRKTAARMLKKPRPKTMHRPIFSFMGRAIARMTCIGSMNMNTSVKMWKQDTTKMQKLERVSKCNHGELTLDEEVHVDASSRHLPRQIVHLLDRHTLSNCHEGDNDLEKSNDDECRFANFLEHWSDSYHESIRCAP